MNQDEPNALLTMKEFPKTYHEEVFQIWYRAGRPSISRLRPLLLPMEENGRIPSAEALQQWRTNDGWVTRADVMDVEVARQNDEKAIQQKIDMLRRHAEVSMALIERGEAYLKEHGVQKAADAIRAIALGMERESLSRGFRIALDDMGKKSDEELVRLVEQRMGLANGVSDDAIDGESTDVTDADTKSE